MSSKIDMFRAAAVITRGIGPNVEVGTGQGGTVKVRKWRTQVTHLASWRSRQPLTSGASDGVNVRVVTSEDTLGPVLHRLVDVLYWRIAVPVSAEIGFERRTFTLICVNVSISDKIKSH